MTLGLPGRERRRHGGLLPDGARLEALARGGRVPALPLDACTEGQLRRQRAGVFLAGAGPAAAEGAVVVTATAVAAYRRRYRGCFRAATPCPSSNRVRMTRP